jgi:hypothetical protein
VSGCDRPNGEGALFGRDMCTVCGGSCDCCIVTVCVEVAVLELELAVELILVLEVVDGVAVWDVSGGWLEAVISQQQRPVF